MRWLRTFAVVFLWTMLPGSGWGADMQLGLAGEVEYDDNVVRTRENNKDDVVFRINPKIRFIEDDGKLQWNVGYQAPWEKALQTERVDGFRHFLTANASYHLSAQTQFFLNDSFEYSDSINTVSTLSEAGTPTVGTFREPVIRNGATLGVQHGFTPRLMGNLAFGNRLFRTDLPSRSDAMVYTGNTNLVYAVSPQHKLGGGAAVAYQDFDESHDGSIAPSQALFLNMYATWTWTLNETMSFELTGGPTFVNNKQDAPPLTIEGVQVIPYEQGTGRVYNFSSCGLVNGFPVLSQCAVDPTTVLDPADRTTTSLSFLDGTNVGGSSSKWTFFGEASLNKRWSPRLVSSLVYRRSESTASGTGSSTLDLVSALTTWRISELWDVGFRADYTKRRSTAPIRETLVVVGQYTTPPYSGAAESIGLTSRVVDNSLDTDRWGVSVRMVRRLTKNIHSSLRYTYNEQSSKSDTVGSTSDFKNHLVTLGVQYDFNRWHLW